ncbi:MAG: COG4280 domain-containing protein, partial [Mesorhizobium sp.]
MHDLTPILSTVAASFLASFVEVVEAFTIVLAVGVTRGWRPALTGAVSALAVLAALVLAFGPLLQLIPIALLQFAVGVLLILFGMRWLRKAILRSAGIIALRDEEAAFSRETDALTRHANDRRAGYLAGVAAFKAVLLEGVEVVFIVIAVGTAHGQTLYAGLGALAAFVLVMLIGLAMHRPLARVPENALKFVVGLMLTSFGVFWTGEG